MIIGQPEELHSINFYFTILQKVHIRRQVFNALHIPEAKVVVPCYENLVFVRQINVPIQEIKHFTLCTIMTDVTAMNDDISLR